MPELDAEERKELKGGQFAFPKQRKEPIEDAAHVRAAIARFDQVEDVTNQERDAAWQRIQAAAKKFEVHLDESDWRDLFRKNDRKIPED